MSAPQLPGSGFFSDLTSPAPSGQGVPGGTTALDSIVAFIKTLLGAMFEGAVTLASDTFAPSQGSYVVSAEGSPGTTTDNLAQLGVTNAYDGMEVRLRATSGQTITVKHNSGSVGKMLLSDGADLVLSDPTQRLWLVYSASAQAWTEEDRAYGNNKAAATAWLNAATSALAGLIKAATIAITRTGTATDTAVTPDALASLWQKGADIASATTLVKPADANLGGYHVITGTTPVTAMWAGTLAGEEYEFEAGGALPLTHGANFALIGGANITCAAGDRFRLRFFGSSVWKMVSFQRASGAALVAPSTGAVVKVANVQVGASATGTTLIPYDDTKPDQSVPEGDQFMSLTFTPTSATNKLKIEVVLFGTVTSTVTRVIVALFKDSVANALAVGMEETSAGGQLCCVKFTHYMTAGSTSAMTFKVRAGGTNSGTFTFNGAAGSELFGGAMASSITISEIVP